MLRGVSSRLSRLLEAIPFVLSTYPRSTLSTLSTLFTLSRSSFLIVIVPTPIHYLHYQGRELSEYNELLTLRRLIDSTFRPRGSKLTNGFSLVVQNSISTTLPTTPSTALGVRRIDFCLFQNNGRYQRCFLIEVLMLFVYVYVPAIISHSLYSSTLLYSTLHSLVSSVTYTNHIPAFNFP